MFRNYNDNTFNTRINEILCYLAMLFLIKPEAHFSFASYPDILFLPTGLFSVLNLNGSITETVVYALSALWRISVIFCVFNFHKNFFSKVVFFIMFLFFNISHNYGWHTHTNMPVVLAAFTLAFGGNQITFLIRSVFCYVFFSAGLSKILNGGWEWVSTDSFQNILIRSDIYYPDTSVFKNGLNMNYFFAQHVIFCKISAFAIILIEFLSPLALIFKRLQLPIVFLLLTMQILIYFTIFVNFKNYLILYLFWIHWDQLLPDWFIQDIKSKFPRSLHV